jgi:hypothetical protein
MVAGGIFYLTNEHICIQNWRKMKENFKNRKGRKSQWGRGILENLRGDFLFLSY